MKENAVIINFGLLVAPNHRICLDGRNNAAIRNERYCNSLFFICSPEWSWCTNSSPMLCDPNHMHIKVKMDHVGWLHRQSKAPTATAAAPVGAAAAASAAAAAGALAAAAAPQCAGGGFVARSGPPATRASNAPPPPWPHRWHGTPSHMPPINNSTHRYININMAGSNLRVLQLKCAATCRNLN